jgi:phosphoribosyl 1,2-cyclic phosphodiesterase
MRVLFCGVRGSTPAPGAEFARVGGHTSCVALARQGGGSSLVLDAGTGLRRLTAVLDGQAFRGTILLTHLHWDHTQGLPFFAAGDRDDATVTVLMPAQGSAEAVLALAMSPPHFPIGPDGLRGHWRFDGIEPGEYQIEGFAVLAAELPHKGGRTFGYRVSDGPASLAYLPDHGPLGAGPGPDGLGARHEAALTLCEGVDVLVHGGQFTAIERERAADFGHATVEYAAALAADAGVQKLVLFHHDPGRTDEQVDAIASALAPEAVRVEFAVEGLEIEI